MRMKKKFIYLNTILILVILLVFIFGDYFSPIEMKFQYWWSTKYLEWKMLSILFLSFAFFSAVISLIDIKNLKYISKFSRVFFSLNCLLLLFLIYNFTELYLTTKRELTKRENELIKEAKRDIKDDNVTYKFAGGLQLPTYSQKNENRIDSIRKKYGIKYINTGCIVDLVEIQAQEKYSETVKSYLEKRNGKNWEYKMQTEIENIKRDIR